MKPRTEMPTINPPMNSLLLCHAMRALPGAKSKMTPPTRREPREIRDVEDHDATALDRPMAKAVAGPVRGRAATGPAVALRVGAKPRHDQATVIA